LIHGVFRAGYFWPDFSGLAAAAGVGSEKRLGAAEVGRVIGRVYGRA
jgi:hypothetical protein